MTGEIRRATFAIKKEDEYMDGEELAVMGVLNYRYHKYDIIPINTELVFFDMFGRYPDMKNRRDKDMYYRFMHALGSLYDLGEFKCVAVHNDSYAVIMDSIYIDNKEDRYTQIDMDDCHKIFNHANKPFDLFKFYFQMLGTVNVNTHVGFTSLRKMYELGWRKNINTIESYIKQLEDLKIIYVYRHGNNRAADGTRLANTYGKYKDKELVIKHAKSVEYA